MGAFYKNTLNWTVIPWQLGGKESACQCKRSKRPKSDPWVRKIPWRRKWQPTPVFLPGKSHGQRSLAGCSLWGHKESNTTEHIAHTYKVNYIRWPLNNTGLNLWFHLHGDFFPINVYYIPQNLLFVKSEDGELQLTIKLHVDFDRMLGKTEGRRRRGQ